MKSSDKWNNKDESKVVIEDKTVTKENEATQKKEARKEARKEAMK